MYIITKILSSLALGALLYLPGWALWILFHRNRPPPAGNEESGLMLFWQVGTGMACGGVVALLLSISGVFNVWSFSLCLVCLLVVVLLVVRPTFRDLKRGFPSPGAVASGALPVFPAILIGLFLFLLPFMNVFGSWDAGVYPNVAGNIERTGSVFYSDPVFPGLSEEERHLFSEDHYYTDENGEKVLKHSTIDLGFYLTDPAGGGVTPQLFYYFPSFLAVSMGFLGVRPGFLLIPLFALLSVWGLFLLARELMGRWASAAASLLLAVGFIQVYFAKYATSEMCAQFFFITGLLAYLKYRKREAGAGGDPAWGFLAGVGFGCMLLSHIDSILIFAPILLVYGFLFVRNGWKDVWKDRLFLITLGLFGAFTVAMSLGPYRTYVTDIQMGFLNVVPGKWATVGAVGAVFVIAVILLRVLPGNVAGFLYRHRKVIMAAACLLLILATIYALFIRPALSGEKGLSAQDRNFNESALSRFTYYITPLGLVLAIIGYCLFMLSDLDSGKAMVLLMGLTFTGVFIYRPLITPVLAYSMRRYVIVVLPVAVLMEAYALYRVYQEARARKPDSVTVRRAAGFGCLGAGAVLLGLLLVASIPLARVPEYRESYPYVKDISATADDDALLLCDEAAGRMLAAPLRCFMGRKVLRLDEDRFISDPGVADIISRYGDEGAETFLLAHWGSDITDRAPGLEFAKVGTLQYLTRMLAVTREPARDIVEFDVSVDIYRVTPKGDNGSGP